MNLQAFPLEGSMKYLSVREMSELWGISPRRIQILCKEGRVPGIIMIGRTWGIPENVEKPMDRRIKSGKYRNKNGREKDGNLNL